MKVKVIGAGSIGNHLAQAARRMGWDVAVVDRDSKALERMKTDIYPTRYGAWDDAIKLYESGKEPKGGFDIIAIGTPPHVRMKLAIEALKEKPKVLQLEKPLCDPLSKDLSKFIALAKKSKTNVVLGYDHAVSASIIRVIELLKQGVVGKPLTLDVEFREHWQGIFKAHPWLSGPADTYLGYWKLGGGASGEHSHALHLWHVIAKAAGLGVWKYVAPTLKIEKQGKAEYDSIASFSFSTDKGAIGRVVQDVVTRPTRKWARVQTDQGFIEWNCNGKPEGDVVRWGIEGGEAREEVFPKKRPDDFYAEMLHIEKLLKGEIRQADSPIGLETGVAVMRVLRTIWKSPKKGLVAIQKL